MLDPDLAIAAERLDLIKVFADEGDPARLLLAIETNIQHTIWKITPEELRALGCWLYANGKLADSGASLPWKPLSKEIN